MITQRLTSDLIADTSLWRLSLLIADTSLQVLLLGPESVERPVISACLPLADDSLTALENAVYEHPLLLGDFARVQIVFSTPSFALVPNELLPQAESICNLLLPDYSELRQLVAAPMSTGVLCALVDASRVNFLRRTFPDAQLGHQLAVAARWLHYFNRQRGYSAHLYALCLESEVMIVAFGDSGEMVLANRFDAPTASDAAYYIHLCAADSPAPISVGGEPSLRNAVCDTLRQVRPRGRILPLTLPEHLLHLQADAPELSPILLFLTEL